MARSKINRGRARRDELRKEAESRASDRASMSLADKIASLDSRLGVGVGAVRERVRLDRELEADRERKSRDRQSKSKSRSKSKSKSSGKPKRTSSRRSKGDRLRDRREVDQAGES